MLIAKVLLKKNGMMLVIIGKNVFEIMTMPNNSVLICRFKYHYHPVSITLYISCNVCFFAEVWLKKTSTRIVKYKLQIVKLNPEEYFYFILTVNV